MPIGEVKVYAGARVADALQELTTDMNLYHGVRLAQVIAAVYEQGLKDGRQQVFETVGEQLEALKQSPELKHRNPGRPRKAAAKKATTSKTAAKKRATAKRATAKKATTSKTAAKKRATAKRATAKRATAKRATAKRATAKRTTAKRSGSRRP